MEGKEMMEKSKELSSETKEMEARGDKMMEMME